MAQTISSPMKRMRSTRADMYNPPVDKTTAEKKSSVDQTKELQ
jgi:hypothetical protein